MFPDAKNVNQNALYSNSEIKWLCSVVNSNLLGSLAENFMQESLADRIGKGGFV